MTVTWKFLLFGSIFQSHRSMFYSNIELSLSPIRSGSSAKLKGDGGILENGRQNMIKNLWPFFSRNFSGFSTERLKVRPKTM